MNREIEELLKIAARACFKMKISYERGELTYRRAELDAFVANLDRFEAAAYGAKDE